MYSAFAHNLIAIMIMLLMVLTGFAQPRRSKTVINSHCISFEPDKSQFRRDRDLKALDTIVNKYELFLIGERHGVSTNPKVCAKMMRYLYDKARVRYLIVEFGNSEAYLINRFLKTRDTSLLEPLFYSQYQEYRELWAELYQLYVRLPQEEKFEVVGIDFEYGPSLIKALNVMIPKYKRIPQEIQSTIAKIKSLGQKDYHDLQNPKEFNARKFIYWLREEFKGRELFFREYFGINYRHIEQIVTNNVFSDSKDLREAEMVNNLIRAYQKQPIVGGYFGMMGLNHTDLKNQSSFAAQIMYEASSPFVNQVMVINSHYQNCAYHYNNLFFNTNTEFLGTVLSKGDASEFISRIQLETQSCDVRLVILNTRDKTQKKIASHGQCLLYIEGQPALQFTVKPMIIFNSNELRE